MAAIRDDRLMQEAIKLTRDGELGNSNAIRLLQLPHSADDLKEVLRKFDHQLTREARAKLALEAYAPLPNGVENQRYEPIFDRYPISGKLYTTASGTVVLNEVQYYNGEMVQLYGECTNLAGVREALAGSGYKPMTLKYADGAETALAQFWAHQLSDTSLRPYNAQFVIAVAVPESTPARQSTINADDNGASSVLPGMDGSYDAATGRYTNRALAYYVRLLDSTRVAIEVGRERMGTDKRPGTIDLTRVGRQVSFTVREGGGHLVAKINFVVADDPLAYRPAVARAAATAGIPFRELPPGTEYVYPSVARIGDAPIVGWEWRTDVLPRLQPALPNTVRFDASSDEGNLLLKLGFRATALGYLPNVRGVVTGVPDASSRPLRVRFKDAKAVVALRPRPR